MSGENEDTGMNVYFIYSNQNNERFIEHLVNSRKFCISCGELCDDCRIPYGSHAKDISGLHYVPEDLPVFVEEPENYLPDTIPNTDVVIAIQIHPDILTALPELLHNNNVQALIVPVEDGDWVPMGLQKQVEEELNKYNIQYAFPRPYCSLMPNNQPLIQRFIEYFQIGQPKLNLITKNNKIIEGNVEISSPCGCAWYLMRELLRYKPEIDDKLKEMISKAHHSYPCNASMNTDIILKDAPLHIAGYIHRLEVYQAILNSTNSPEDFSDIIEEIIELKKKINK
ncbi:MAG: thymidylate synthase [Candidatus Lokiarchaeota archaeon]|nr:thymidylate synthase [Candidatus Lokiarchaeota archaeon]